MLTRTFIRVIVVLISAVALAFADPSATLTGFVSDAMGRSVPNAHITVSNLGTNIEYVMESNNAGVYSSPPLEPGVYRMTVLKDGFKTLVKSGIDLHVQDVISVNFSLEIGSVTESVTVESGVPLLQTDDSSVGQVVNSREINNLPLNGRNYALLAQLTSGVTTTVKESRGLAATGSFSSNGVPSLYNSYILDGVDNNNNTVDFLNGAAYAVRPPLDAIREFKVQTSNFSAEFGRVGGSLVNAIVKSGTNELHGDLWEFLRNNSLDASDFFLNAAGKSKGEYRRNQFGFTVGGPVLIPRVYNGKNRTFFFADYEGTRIRQAQPFTSAVPTAAERASGYTNFSELISGQTGYQTDNLGRTFPLGTVFDPATTRGVKAGFIDPATGRTATTTGYVREAFAGNLLPLSRVDPTAVKLLNLFPAPNAAGIFNNFVSQPVHSDDTDSFDVRIDHNFSQQDQTFFRISSSSEPQYFPSPLGGLAGGAQSFAVGNQSNNVLNGAWGETHIFSPTTVNQFLIGYHRIHTERLQPFAQSGGLNEQYGIPGIPDTPPNGGLAQIEISGLSELGSHNNLPLNELNGTLQFTDNFSKQLGSHALKVGAEYQRIKVAVLSSQFPHGYFTFNGAYTSIPNLNAGNTGIAQFVIDPTSANVAGGINNVGGAVNVQVSPLGQEDYRRPYYGSYIQDDWKATRKLTVNLGVRWEYFQLPTDNFGAEANFLPGTPFNGAEYLIDARRRGTLLSSSFVNSLATDGIELGYTNNYQLGNAQKTNFAPRVGFAYQLTPRFVIRSGYGIFYNGVLNTGDGANLGNNYPFEFGLSFLPSNSVAPVTPDNSIGKLSNGLLNVSLVPSAVNANGLNLRGIQYNLQTPYIQDLNFTLQYQVTSNQSITAAYVGSLGRHLLTTPGTNLPSVILPPNVNVQQYVPFPEFARGSSYSATDGNSFYHSLQIKFERKFTNGLSTLAAYTWSKLRTDTQDILFSTPGYRAPSLPGFGIQGDYGLGGFDVRQALHFSGVYELPFGRGKRFLSNGRLVDYIVGGWSISGLVTLQSGQPFTVGCSISTGAGTGCNALLVPGQNIYAGARTVNHWINSAAFANPAVATSIGQSNYAPLGGAPTQAIGPGFHRADLSVAKQWRTSETTHLEFRSEFFNLTNTPNFSNPAFLTLGNQSNFGQITSTRDNPDDAREIQFALKFYF
jgi:Carboxypeptidase regulatory-like domain